MLFVCKSFLRWEDKVPNQLSHTIVGDIDQYYHTVVGAVKSWNKIQTLQ